VERGNTIHAQRRGQPESVTKQDTGDIKALSDSIRVLVESETHRAHLMVESADRRTASENHRAHLQEDGENSRHVRQRIGDLQDRAREYRKMYTEADNTSSRRALFYHEEEQQITSEIAALLDTLTATPRRENLTPPTRQGAARLGKLQF
jgi:hypothetical protein